MIKTIKPTLSEKILFVFLILLLIFTLGSFYILNNKCLFVKKIDLDNINYKDKKNIAIMEVECGKVLIELNPNISPKAVNRFKKLVNKGSYNGSAFYRVIEDTLIQAGDIEYGNISNLNYSKVGTGKSDLGMIKSELSNSFLFNAGSVAFARKDRFDTEDSEFFITLIDIPIYQGCLLYTSPSPRD